tara:strand:- start:121 stop:441 length:321 start_codon:yes stop_codon:yes gene_type:complete
MRPIKALGFEDYLPNDAPNDFLDLKMAKPVPEGQDILVAVRAIAINTVDTKVRANRGLPAKVENDLRVIYYDASGVVEALGSDATLFKMGDAVWYAGDITRSGCNA